jgi:uncharacterized protein DUF3467
MASTSANGSSAIPENETNYEFSCPARFNVRLREITAYQRKETAKHLTPMSPLTHQPGAQHQDVLAMTINRTVERPNSASGENINIRWDDSGMRSAYANVCNVHGTREELVLLFGVNQSWNAGNKELVIQLIERIILSPFAAKRLNLLLSRVLKEYESRYGQLPIETGENPRPAETLPTS